MPSLEALAALLRERLGEEPVVLVGHSQSCQVVVAAAQGEPRVAGLVLLGPTTNPRLRVPGVLPRRWLRTAVAEPVWQLPLVVAQWVRTGPAGMIALWRTTSPDRIDRRLCEVRVPVTVVRGTRDRLCPGDWAAAVAAAAPYGRVLELPKAAHMTVQTHPGPLARLLTHLLTEPAAGSGETARREGPEDDGGGVGETPCRHAARRCARSTLRLALARVFAAWRTRRGPRSMVPRVSRPTPMPSSHASLTSASPSCVGRGRRACACPACANRDPAGRRRSR